MKTLLSILLVVVASFVVADIPKPGTYLCEQDEGAVKGDLGLSKRGNNFQVEGKVTTKTGTSTFKGTWRTQARQEHLASMHRLDHPGHRRDRGFDQVWIRPLAFGVKRKASSFGRS